MTTQELLEKISHQGLGNTSKDEMVRLACAYWHENFWPDVDRILQLDKETQRTAGYLTEFFSSFHCVEKERIAKLVKLAHRIKANVHPNLDLQVMTTIAEEWGVKENMSLFLDDILFYQTRHYKHHGEGP